MKISNLALYLDFTSNIYGRAFDSFGQKTVYFYPDEDYPVESEFQNSKILIECIKTQLNKHMTRHKHGTIPFVTI